METTSKLDSETAAIDQIKWIFVSLEKIINEGGWHSFSNKNTYSARRNFSNFYLGTEESSYKG